MPLNLTWQNTGKLFRADAGAFILLALPDLPYAWVNGGEFFRAAIAFRPAPGRLALIVAQSGRSPDRLEEVQAYAVRMLPGTVAKVRESFQGLLPDWVLEVPGLEVAENPGKLSTTTPAPQGRTCWLELD